MRGGGAIFGQYLGMYEFRVIRNGIVEARCSGTKEAEAGGL